MSIQQQAKPSAVRRAKQGGETSWVETAVWTDRMLEALERGVRGGVWFTLIDKVYRKENLEAAYERVKENGGSAGVDHVSVGDFGKRLDEELGKLSDALRDGSYRPQPIRRVYIPKAGGGERPLGIPTVRDRVVQAALKQTIEPIFEHEFLPCSYGFRPNRGCKDALRKVDELLRAGHAIVLDADIRRYFDTISHEKLIALVERRIQDSRVIKLIAAFLHQGIFEQGEEREPAQEGTPQGGVISPLLANIYLHELDTALTAAGINLVRYADDFVVLADTEAKITLAKEIVTKVMTELELELHPDKTHVVDMRQPDAHFEFLGYRFKNHKGRILRYPRHKSIMKLRETIRQRTPRLNGKALKDAAEQVNQVLSGWYNYFQHSSVHAFDSIDGWIRMRFRAILSRRHRGSSRRYGSAHLRWPNAYFHTLGLLCLTKLHSAQRLQPAQR